MMKSIVTYFRYATAQIRSCRIIIRFIKRQPQMACEWTGNNNSDVAPNRALGVILEAYF